MYVFVTLRGLEADGCFHGYVFQLSLGMMVFIGAMNGHMTAFGPIRALCCHCCQNDFHLLSTIKISRHVLILQRVCLAWH